MSLVEHKELQMYKESWNLLTTFSAVVDHLMKANIMENMFSNVYNSVLRLEPLTAFSSIQVMITILNECVNVPTRVGSSIF